MIDDMLGKSHDHDKHCPKHQTFITNNIFIVLESLSNILANFVYTGLSEINGSSFFPNRQEICRGSTPTEKILVAINLRFCSLPSPRAFHSGFIQHGFTAPKFKLIRFRLNYSRGKWLASETSQLNRRVNIIYIGDACSNSRFEIMSGSLIFHHLLSPIERLLATALSNLHS
jgi:hypothetical protein